MPWRVWRCFIPLAASMIWPSRCWHESWRFEKRSSGRIIHDVGVSLDALGLIKFHQRHYPEAAALYLRALVIWGRIYGEENPWLSADLSILADCYESMNDFAALNSLCGGQFATTKTVCRPTVPIWGPTCTISDPCTSTTRRYQEAAPLLQRALDIRTKALGLNDRDTIQTLETYANLLHYLRSRSDASELDRR